MQHTHQNQPHQASTIALDPQHSPQQIQITLARQVHQIQSHQHL